MIRRVTVALFLLLCLMPLAQMATGLVPEDPVDEQRRLAPPPDLRDPLHVPRSFNSWFSDHFGLRSLLIRVKGQIDLSLFGLSDRVHIGHDGYYFYRNVMDRQKPDMERKIAAHGPAMAANMRRFVAALHDAGVEMTLFVNLLGDRFLPDKLPDDVAARAPLRRIDGLIADYARTPGLHFIDATAILQRAQRERPIFHRTDFHWNDPAAYDIAAALVGEMSRTEGRPRSIWNTPLQIEEREIAGGVTRFMPVLWPPREITTFLAPTWQIPPHWRQWIDRPPFEIVTSGASVPDPLGPVLMVGDSFLDGVWRAGLPVYFSTTHRLRWAPGLSLSRIVEVMPPETRWLLMQFIEVNSPAADAFADSADVDRAIALLQARPRPEAAATGSAPPGSASRPFPAASR